MKSLPWCAVFALLVGCGDSKESGSEADARADASDTVASDTAIADSDATDSAIADSDTTTTDTAIADSDATDTAIADSDATDTTPPADTTPPQDTADTATPDTSDTDTQADPCAPVEGDNLAAGTPCDPVDQPCAGGLGCYFQPDWQTSCDFRCTPIYGPGLLEGRTCQYSNDCSPGLSCTGQRYARDCPGDACCVPWCDVDAPVCDADEVCTNWFTLAEMAEPGTAGTGTCLPNEDIHCRPAPGASLPVETPCDPLDDRCAPNLGCHETWDSNTSCDFRCLAPTGPGGAEGASCGLDDLCAPGLACVWAKYRPGCTTELCCTPYCDLRASDCPDDTTCVSWYFSADRVAGLEHVGVCIEPSGPPKVDWLVADADFALVGTTRTLIVMLDQPAPAGGVVVTISASGAAVEVPAEITVPAGMAQADFQLTAGPDVGTATIQASGGGGEATIDIDIREPGSVGLVLAEVFYNPAGGDSGFEWVKLYNGSAAAIDLAGYSLAWRGATYSNGGNKLQLAGTVQPGACFVIGGPSPSAGVAVYDQVNDFEPDIQNGGTDPGEAIDAVSLYNVVAAEVSESTLPIDVAAWGSANVNNVLGPDGPLTAANAPVVNGQSVRRKTLGTWVAADASAACVVITE